MAENKKNTNIDGDGFETYSPYKSKCAECIHFNVLDYNCKAFPSGIPEQFLSGKDKHDKVISSQIGTTVFTT